MLVNKRAQFDYKVYEKVEAGVVLTGPEVKSLRLGRASLADSHVVFKDREAYLLNVNISGYSFADMRDYEPTRSRKLLLHKNEVDAWTQKVQAEGFSVIPLAVYFKQGRVKVELGLVRGKKKFEKREDIKRKDLEREVKIGFKQRLR